MLKRFYHFFISRTHSWRTVSISEMAELYSSRMLRVVAMHMLGGFGAVYLYQLGYSLQWLALYYAIYFAFRIPTTPIVALLIARYGPKHSILISNIMFIFAALLLALTPSMGLVALVLLIPVGSLGRSLYETAYWVDFSKVKHIDHAGKEIGLMQIIERVMTAAAPIIGGLIAFLFGPVAMMVFAGIVMLISALPLFFTSEPVKVHQKITLRHFNFRSTWKLMLANVGVGIDTNSSGLIWNLFLAIVIFGVASNSVYLEIGILGSVALVASIAVSYLFGKVVDKSGGKRLIILSTIGNSLMYFVKPLAVNPMQVASINVANEVVTTGYNIPAIRGVFNTADGLPGYRIVFISIMVGMLAVGDTFASIVLLIMSLLLPDDMALRGYYFALAPFAMLILFHVSALYRRGILSRFIHRV